MLFFKSLKGSVTGLVPSATFSFREVIRQGKVTVKEDHVRTQTDDINQSKLEIFEKKFVRALYRILRIDNGECLRTMER